MWIPEMTLHCLAIISFQCQSTSTETGAWEKPRHGRRLYPVEYSSLLPSLPEAVGSAYDDGRYSTQDCLEGFRVCNSKQWICKIDLDIFKQFCGDWRNEKSLLACPRAYFKECRSALNTVLLGRPNLKHCTCDGQLSRSIEDMARCNLLRRNLNHHPCLMEQPVFGSQVEKEPNPPIRATAEYDSLSVGNSPKPVQRLPPIENEKELSNTTTTSPPLIQSNNPAQRNSPTSPFTFANQTGNTPMRPTLANPEVSRESSQEKVDRTLQPPGNGTRLRVDNPPGFPASPGGLKSCLLFLDGCTGRPGCARALNNFRALCNIRSCARLRLQCGKAHKELQKYVKPWNCTCSNEGSSYARQRCQDYQTKITENKCVAEWSASVGVDGSSVDDGDDASHLSVSEPVDRRLAHQTSPGEASRVSVPSPLRTDSPRVEAVHQNAGSEHLNCFTLYMSCLRNTSCLRWYLELAKRCSQANCPASMVCETRPPTVSPMDSVPPAHALTCRCPSNDRDCQRQQKVLHMRCSPTREISAKHCLNLWMKCRLNNKCRQVYQRLATECLPTGLACASDPLACRDLHRQLVGQSGSRHCYCGPGNDALVEGHWISGACTDFQAKLNHPPCSDTTFDETTTESRIATSGTKLQACEIIHKLHLPNTRVVKLEIAEGLNHHCYAFCTCELGCTRRTCLSTKSTSDIPGHLAEMEQVEKHFTKLPWLEFPAICLNLPSFDRTCVCIMNKHVKCTRSAKKKITCGKDYQLEIEYQIAQLAMILSTNWERSSGERLRQIFQLVYIMVDQLADTVQRTVGNTECRLVATEFSWVYRGHSSSDGHTRNSPATNSSVELAGLQLRSVFILAVETKAEDSDCHLTLSLVETLINHRLPQMVYHPLLSALQSARMLETAESGEQCSSPQNTPSSQSLQSWRKPRSEGQPTSSGNCAHVNRPCTAGVIIVVLISCLRYATAL